MNLDDINRAYTFHRRTHGEPPSYLVVGDNEYEELFDFYFESYPGVKDKPEGYEDDFTKFQRLLHAGIFCIGNVVLRIKRIVEVNHFSVE